MLLSIVAKLREEDWAKITFEQRVELIKQNYNIDQINGIVVYQKFFKKNNIGVFFAYQSKYKSKFRGVNISFGKANFLSHYPFCSNGNVYCDENAAINIVELLQNSPCNISMFNPPLAVWCVDEIQETVKFWNDSLGLGKTFLLETESSECFVLSSRPIAAHLMALIEPEPSTLGWASEQLLGWYVSDLTPYKNLIRIVGGSHIIINQGCLEHNISKFASDLFLGSPTFSLQDSYESFSCQIRQFYNPNIVDVALSGGRDSRASAAIAYHYLKDIVKFRTNSPPALEGIIARQLIAKLENFQKFNENQTRAFSNTGNLLWASKNPKISDVEIEKRAKGWVETYEGIAASVSLYSTPPCSKLFDNSVETCPSIAGVGGESAKAYYWSKNMRSGAYAQSLKSFMQDIKSIHISKRIKEHPLTKISDYPFILEEFREKIANKVYVSQADATRCGIHGYRFLDYWWLMNRFAAGTTIAYRDDNTIMPFMDINYMKIALQQSPQERAKASLLCSIVKKFNSSWVDIGYFDEVQHMYDRKLIQYYRNYSLLWEGDLKNIFFDLLHDDTIKEHPYSYKKIISYFNNVLDDVSTYATLNIKAYGIVHYYFFSKYCKEIARKIYTLKYV